MIIDKNDKKVEHSAIEMAMAVLMERISSLPEDDRRDLFDLLPALVSDDDEERESAAKAMHEVLAQAPVRAEEVEIAAPAGDGLQTWINYVSKRIKEARKAAGMTQTQLEEKSGIPQSHISRLESGEHSPSFVTLEKIAAAIGIPVGDLDPSA
ncbi:MAG: helix-turn-helix domain-containing protein [Planctomycetota bacterium]